MNPDPKVLTKDLIVGIAADIMLQHNWTDIRTLGMI
jgi:hypothetical protein